MNILFYDWAMKNVLLESGFQPNLSVAINLPDYHGTFPTFYSNA